MLQIEKRRKGNGERPPNPLMPGPQPLQLSDGEPLQQHRDEEHHDEPDRAGKEQRPHPPPKTEPWSKTISAGAKPQKNVTLPQKVQK